MSIRESRFGRLVGHFFTGFLDNDLLVSSEGGMRNLLSQVSAVLITPGLFYCLLGTLKYGSLRGPVREMLASEDRFLFVHFAMIVSGFLTIIEWDALFQDRRDFQILAPLPITTRLVFAAKVCSVLLLLVIIWAAANLGPALLFPAVVVESGDSGLAFLHHAAAHLIATLAASVFVFLFFIGLLGVLLNALPPKWFRRVSVYAQGAAIVCLMLLFLLLPPFVAQAIRGFAATTHGCLLCHRSGLWASRGANRQPQPVFLPLAGMAMKGLSDCGRRGAGLSRDLPAAREQVWSRSNRRVPRGLLAD
jgi:hypothetical protein